MDELMGRPPIDPHGSPIPDKDGKIAQEQFEPLSNYKPGTSLKLAALSHSSAEFLKFLNSRELSLGTHLKIKSVEPFDGSMVVAYKGHPAETFTRTVCEKLLVEPQ